MAFLKSHPFNDNLLSSSYLSPGVFGQKCFLKVTQPMAIVFFGSLAHLICHLASLDIGFSQPSYDNGPEVVSLTYLSSGIFGQKRFLKVTHPMAVVLFRSSSHLICNLAFWKYAFLKSHPSNNNMYVYPFSLSVLLICMWLLLLFPN